MKQSFSKKREKSILKKWSTLFIVINLFIVLINNELFIFSVHKLPNVMSVSLNSLARQNFSTDWNFYRSETRKNKIDLDRFDTRWTSVQSFGREIEFPQKNL